MQKSNYFQNNLAVVKTIGLGEYRDLTATQYSVVCVSRTFNNLNWRFGAWNNATLQITLEITFECALIICSKLGEEKVPCLENLSRSPLKAPMIKWRHCDLAHLLRKHMRADVSYWCQSSTFTSSAVWRTYVEEESAEWKPKHWGHSLIHIWMQHLFISFSLLELKVDNRRATVYISNALKSLILTAALTPTVTLSVSLRWHQSVNLNVLLRKVLFQINIMHLCLSRVAICSLSVAHIHHHNLSWRLESCCCY